jgi:hypothetical protein
VSDDLRRRLDEAGRRPAPPPDPAFADSLEERLLAVRASLPSAPAPVPPARSRPRIPVGRWVTAAAVAAVIVLVAGLGLGLLRPDPTPSLGLALAGPVNVEVALADGTILEDPDGLLLPEGAVVTVGEGGSARIGDTVLRPGDVVVVEGDRLEVQRPTPVGAVPDPTPGPTARPAATERPATSEPTTPPPDRPDATATPSPAPTAPPARTAEPTPPPARTDPPATAQPTPTPTPAILRPRLRARLVDGPRIAIRWTATVGAARYVLVATASRSGPAADPAYPGARVIGTFAAPPERAVRIRVPDGIVEVRLMVVALREDGRVLRRSRIVTIAIPVPGEPLGSSPSPSSGPSPTPPFEPSPTPPFEPSPTPAP